MTIIKSTWILILPAAAAAICFGQGSISGKILTAAGNGAAIPNAPVQAKNLATQEISKAASASDGSYALSGLAPGAYEISVENVTFFLPFHRSGVQVAAGKTTRLDIPYGQITHRMYVTLLDRDLGSKQANGTLRDVVCRGCLAGGYS